MKQSNIVFTPIQGTEAQIMATNYREGHIYFATDSKKIYLDANGESKLPMGGNSGIYYGVADFGVDIPENQTEFEFTVYDIEGNDKGNRLIIPNINDLILNKDGCFYRVIELNNEGVDTIIITNKLTLTGSGSSPSGPSEDVGEFKLSNITPKNITILSDQNYSIGFKAIATDSEGIATGNGTYTLSVGGIQKETGAVAQGDNYIPIEKYLSLGENKIRIVVYMDIGGADLVSKSLSYTITTTEMKLTWNYDATQINNTHSNFDLTYEVSGIDIAKTVNLVIDDLYTITLAEGLTSTSQQIYTFTPTDLLTYNLIHGAHKFRLQASATLNGNLNYTNPIVKSIMFADITNATPIISHSLFDRNLVQYNTVFIPIIIYSSDNIASNATVILREEGIEIDRWENVANSVEKIWSYTPLVAGTRLLTIQCGTSEVSFTVEVEELGIGIEEVGNYAYRFKASDFASNAAVQNWNSNGVTATFNNFDWINGGLKSDEDESGNNRQYVCIKAGSQMIIDHELFTRNAKIGKNLKIIFQAANCRDYDAQVLECKTDTKIINVDTTSEIYLPIETETVLTIGETIIVNGELYELSNTSEQALKPNDSEARAILKDRFIERFEEIDLDATTFIEKKYFTLVNDEYILATAFNDEAVYYEQKFYQIKFGEVETEEETNEKTYYAYYYVASIEDSFEGFIMNAQYATLNSRSSTLSTQYCEDTYIELEFDISPQDTNNSINPKNYIKYWIDGVPSGYTIYSGDDSFMTAAGQKITIGSPDCDVYLYMIKLYEKSLTNDEHLNNFIMDAPNAMEMLKRFKRNDIMDPNRKTEISPTKLSLANPDCLVHVYTLTSEGMPITKKTKRQGCQYHQYHNSDTAVLSATDVTIKVQGTSSEKYVVAAANIDTEFTTGLTDVVNNKHIDGWSMDGGNAIPVDFFCTKVNVASCEHANNALNQEWYNMFQPYQTVVRAKNPRARDTMQFTNGVMFVVDKNQTYNTGENDDKKLNNVFGDTSGYKANPYAKMYSIAQMGNSKDNIEVFHDNTNPLECCIEVKDNQTPQQWMVSDDYEKSDIGEGEDYFEFRYPDGADSVKKLGENGQRMIDGWNRFVSWMANSNPQPRYEKHIATSEEEYRTFAFNQKTQKDILTYQFEDEINYVLTGYNPDITEYYTETEHVKGYTNQPLGETKHFDAYTFRGYRCTEQVDAKGEMWQKNYTPLIAGLTVSTYAGDYDRDTYEYRMAKMLSECEDYLVMDSVVYHYLFIERHTMIDNVAKNTFWSTEDCVHWNLTKDYDNDTADGNDNNGKFTRTYGMEIMDKLNASTYVFNAHQAVWLNFVHGLPTVREHMYQQIDNKTVEYNGRILQCWNANDYLWLFKQWQSRIPERCWIEDYYRKYFRPYELYNDTMFNSMMEGGPKTYQRKQYETYQNTYMSSEYAGSDTQSSYLIIRSNGKGMLDAPLAVEVYSDCYIRMDTGSDTNVQRVKRNERNFFRCPTNNLNNATMYFYPAKAFSVIGSTKPGEGMVGNFYPEQISFVGAGKLRELVVSTYNSDTTNESLKTGFDLLNNPMLETLHAANLSNYTSGLNLSNCANLREVDARNSTFTAVEIADNAPVTSIKLQNPTSLSLSNTSKLETLSIENFGRLSILKLHSIDNDKISTLDLVNSAYALNNYRLNNVNWELNKGNDINNGRILILDRLLSKHPIEDPHAATGYEPLQTALTGNLTITANAYNGEDSFNIYNIYSQDDIYPNLDITFTGSTAKLYSVKIYDGDNSVCWQRKINSGNNIDNIFLSDGPQGAFDISMVYKSNTPSHIYNFNGVWKVYAADNLDGNALATITKTEGLMPYYGPVTQDIVIIPQFDEKDRYYTLNFYGVDTTTPFKTESYKYGSKWADVQPTIIPYKESPAGLYEAWDFKGYSLVMDSTTLVPTAYEVTNNQSFYAVFELVSDIRTVVHPEWFNFVETTYTFDTQYASYAPLPNKGQVNGYVISPKVSLQGKVVIPSYYNKKPVIKIERYFATDPNANLTHNITHIFCEADSQLLEIGDYAFEGTNLQYFDFSQNTVRAICSFAFNKCNKMNASLFNLSTNLFYVGPSAFNAALTSINPVTITIPSNVALVHQFGFNNPKVARGSGWEIGSEEVPSKLDLSWPGMSQDYLQKFAADDGIMPNVVFRTARYSSWDEVINNNQLGLQVYQAFVRSGQSQENFNLSMNP